MTSWGAIWALARAEMRQIRRLARYWVFVVIALLFSFFSYLQLWGIHHFFSGESASAAAMNPRYFVAVVGSNFIFFFLFGLIFLSYDIRARDRRERIHEVLDSRPFSNLELVLGRALGILIVCWIPAAVATVLLQILAVLLKAPIEPRSLITYIVFMTLPAYVFTMGLVYFLTLLLRNRLASSIAVILFLVLLFIGGRMWAPLYITPAIDLSGGGSVPFASDLYGPMIDSFGILQRIAWLVAGLGLLWLATAIYPRSDDGSRAVRAGIGVAAIVVGASIAAFQVAHYHGQTAQREAWRAAHESRQGDPIPDLQFLRGNVFVRPGSDVGLELTLSFAAPAETALERALFTLNPGLRIEKITGAGGGALAHTFANGLLEVELPQSLAPGAMTAIELSASGRPDPIFGYLDAVIELWNVVQQDAALAILGYESSLLDAEFVALMPGTRWLPATGTETGRNDSRSRKSDFFDVDLTVELPEGWLAAGPGERREEGVAGGRVRYRFAPPAPVPDVALIASRFASVSAEVEGVRFELLLHPSHTGNVELFEDAGGEIRDWLAEPLREAREVGLEYPYGALTVVEVPVSLRGYGGGWRMDTTLAQPGMILLRESSFPTAKFARSYDTDKELEDLAEQEGGVARAKRRQLERFFEADLSGGNPFVAASRNFVGFQTAGTGPEGLALDYVCETLATRLLTDKQGYFSVHLFDAQIGQRFQDASMQMGDPDRIGDSYAQVMMNMLASSPSTWEQVLQVSLKEIDPWKDPEQTIHVLELKGRAMAQSLLDFLEREKAGRFLGALLEQTRGRAYTREDVLVAGRAVGLDLDAWLQHWIDQTDLPGFVLVEVRAHRLERPAEERGAPQYQTLVTVANEQSCPGLLRVEVPGSDDGESSSSEPVYVDGRNAVEIGIVTSKPPLTLRVKPYLALNREPFAVPVPPVDEEQPVLAEPFEGSRPVAWAPPEPPFIVVDDLDQGFRVEEVASSGFLPRLIGGGSDEQLDQGLPINEIVAGPPSRWSRRAASWAWGHYRHTHAIVRRGKGERKAIFVAELPRPGEWELEFYLPKRLSEDGRGNPDGKWKLSVEHPNGNEPVTFDAEVGQPGWNSLGRFDLGAGEVRVQLSNETDGRWVAADAIRWKPMGSEVAQR